MGLTRKMWNWATNPDNSWLMILVKGSTMLIVLPLLITIGLFRGLAFLGATPVYVVNQDDELHIKNYYYDK